MLQINRRSISGPAVTKSLPKSTTPLPPAGVPGRLLPVHAAVLSLDQQAQDILNDPEARVAEGGSLSLGDVPVMDEIDFVRDMKLQGLRQRGMR